MGSHNGEMDNGYYKSYILAFKTKSVRSIDLDFCMYRGYMVIYHILRIIDKILNSSMFFNDKRILQLIY